MVDSMCVKLIKCFLSNGSYYFFIICNSLKEMDDKNIEDDLNFRNYKILKNYKIKIKTKEKRIF